MRHPILTSFDEFLNLRYGTDRNIMKSPLDVKNLPSTARPRGRPRSEQARRAILKATQELLAEGGITSVTIEGIAARAGVGKPTIYRSWPNAHAVTMAALMESDLSTSPATAPSASKNPAAEPAGQSPCGQQLQSLNALRTQLREVVRVFTAPLGRNIAMMIAASEADTELSKAFRNQFILARRVEGRALLEQAIADGEIRNDLELETALDLIHAPVFYRLLLGHAPLTPQFTDSIINLALEGLAATRK
jgi:AcrR family transcriptional regulator